MSIAILPVRLSKFVVGLHHFLAHRIRRSRQNAVIAVSGQLGSAPEPERPKLLRNHRYFSRCVRAVVDGSSVSGGADMTNILPKLGIFFAGLLGSAFYLVFFIFMFFVVNGAAEYDPRIHRVFFCPQLSKHDSDNKLVPVEGEEIGKLLVQQIQDGVVQKHPWYEPIDKLPSQPVIPAPPDTNFETLVFGRSTHDSAV